MSSDDLIRRGDAIAALERFYTENSRYFFGVRRQLEQLPAISRSPVARRIPHVVVEAESSNRGLGYSFGSIELTARKSLRDGETFTWSSRYDVVPTTDWARNKERCLTLERGFQAALAYLDALHRAETENQGGGRGG